MSAPGDRPLTVQCSQSSPESPSTHPKGTLYIEVKLIDDADDDPFVDLVSIKKDVLRSLKDDFVQVRIGTHLDMKSLKESRSVQSVKVTGHSSFNENGVYHVLSENILEVALYSLSTSYSADQAMSQHEVDESPTQFSVTALPHKDFDGLWESLTFGEPISESILRKITRMMRIFTNNQLAPADICWHNLILLHGPPGTGKTTLAQALAQKLSIRMLHLFPAARFLEVNSHTLLSKWFGDSSKLVGQLFQYILNLSSDESLLTVVLIDEVETLAGSREKASEGNECGDVLRSTNELLQGLDKLRNRPNVVVICTSNLKELVDAAFVDRCRIKEFVDSPNPDCVYEILRTALNELIRKDLAHFNNSETQTDSGPSKAYIPCLDWVVSHLEYRPNTIPMQLRRIARTAVGVSARALRALPFSALVGHMSHEPCDMGDLLEALQFEIDKEQGVCGGICLPTPAITPSKSSASMDKDSDGGGCKLSQGATTPIDGDFQPA